MLAYLLAMQLLVAPGAYDGCGIHGDATGARTAALDALKNRSAPPPAPNPAVTLAAMLAPHDDRARWKDTDGATLEGVVVKVASGGLETVNCHKADPAHVDTHIMLALAAGAPGTKAVVVEVTPRWRAAERARGVDWSTPALERLVGRRVAVTGWLMLDVEHVSQSANTHRGAGNWRATAWELHPVTAIEAK